MKILSALAAAFVIFFACTDGAQGFREGQWNTTKWSPCSRTCGTASRRYREVFCYRAGRRVQQSLCFGTPPLKSELCEAIDCPPERYTKVECNKTCTESGRASLWHCKFTNREGKKINADLSKCNIIDKFHQCVKGPSNSQCPVFRYAYASWSTCSTTCGEGVQTRNVVCLKKRKAVKKVAYKKCSHLKEPAKQQVCKIKPCSEKYEYTYSVSNWSQCDTECGSGEQNRTVVCVQVFENGTKRSVGEDICKTSLLGAVTKTRGCRASLSCKWSPVSGKPCERGELRYRVSSHCTNTKTNDAVDDEFCKNKRPEAEIKPCLYRWKATEWTQCSASCGGGTQRRNVTCYSYFSDSAHGQERAFNDSLCQDIPTPPRERKCLPFNCNVIFPTLSGKKSECKLEVDSFFCNITAAKDLYYQRILCELKMAQERCPCMCIKAIYQLKKDFNGNETPWSLASQYA